MRALVWFRADLRIEDNLALCAATEEATEGVAGFFLYCPQQWQRHDWGERRVLWVHRHVEQLQETLATLHIPLFIRVCSTFADAPACIVRVVQEHDCHKIYWNREYEFNEQKRDKAVAAHCQEAGLEISQWDDQVLVPPGLIKTKTEDWYKVFTPFKKRLIEYLGEQDGPQRPRHPIPQPPQSWESDALPDALDGYTRDVRGMDAWPAGEAEAHRRLASFVEHRIDTYKDLRDIPGRDGTSTLSPYLTVGAISPRQCVEAVLQETMEPWLDIAWHGGGASTWISELIWRDFYRHLLVAYPRLCKYKAFQVHTEALAWRDAELDFEAWTQGRTGIPIIDAAMVQLAETGWMHNRLRMLVAMFLTKHLLIDWRKGERWFMQQLLDGDLASNNGGWQWAASTGTDAAPYFRVFNPWTQSERFDPDGDFIKRMLPALRDVPAKALHDQARLARVKPAEYPAPICEHKQARQRAIDAFKLLQRGD